MEIKEFIEKFAEAVELENVESLTPETEFREFDEWSSLAGLAVIAMVDDEYEVTLKGDDIKSSNTIQDIYNKVQSKL